MKKILIVEDDNFLAEIYKAKLEKQGFAVEIAEDGEAALRKLSNTFFDLVLLDIVLPKMNGWQILENIRNEKKFENLKVIVLSNLFEKKDFDRGARLGIVKYFVKAETTPDDVIEAIKDVLQ